MTLRNDAIPQRQGPFRRSGKRNRGFFRETESPPAKARPLFLVRMVCSKVNTESWYQQ